MPEASGLLADSKGALCVLHGSPTFGETIIKALDFIAKAFSSQTQAEMLTGGNGEYSKKLR